MYVGRHPYPPFVIQYRYRFRAPDHRTYGSSWSSFTAEILENFNWNYLDHYICTRGDTDFSLIEVSWRFVSSAVICVEFFANESFVWIFSRVSTGDFEYTRYLRCKAARRRYWRGRVVATCTRRIRSRRRIIYWTDFCGTSSRRLIR